MSSSEARIENQELAFIKPRKFVRYAASLRADYQVVDEDEAARTLAESPGFRSLSQPLQAPAAKDAITVFAEDISVGGFKMHSEEPVITGARSLLQMHLDDVPVAVGALALVAWAKTERNSEALHAGDLDRIKRYRLLQKRVEIQKRQA